VDVWTKFIRQSGATGMDKLLEELGPNTHSACLGVRVRFFKRQSWWAKFRFKSGSLNSVLPLRFVLAELMVVKQRLYKPYPNPRSRLGGL
jgi:hypothetical protein